jgi:hypothetical protein
VTLRSSHSDALDLFSSPTALPVHFLRTLALGSAAMSPEAGVRRSNNTLVDVIARACWWPEASAGAATEGERRLRGEVQLPKGLKPSFLFPRHSLWVRLGLTRLDSSIVCSRCITRQYTLVLLPPSPTGFAPAANPTEPLTHERVKVTTANARGVVPRSDAPPGYEVPKEGNYNISVGFLENGNQRFIGHHHALG